ncbi:hypothetical protein CCP1ISM_100010 [Azospirillaceae bacterium]
MKIYEIRITTEIDELELSCIIDGDDEVIDDIERDYRNGIAINHCDAVVDIIDHYSWIAAEDFAFGYDGTPGIIPSEQPCVYHANCKYWIDEPMKWSETTEAAWEADPKIGYVAEFRICTGNDIMKRHVLEWISKKTSFGKCKSNVRYLGRTSLGSVAPDRKLQSEPFMPLMPHFLDDFTDKTIFI